ncbi:response regulator transcription factor [Alicyclobacillus pomorum]|uniref:response regulator transcription factor n=1 Tax=Alicyclobacillus pomorum TaxID=204470 RepID=UPI000479B10D|nr:response regulator transcription factor [Alicyclobacillus pomorum]
MEAVILVVDDEPKVIEVIKPFLEGEGFKVYTAMTGKAAIEMVEVHHPDLVLLDWMLPEMSGLDVCRELRQTRDVAIIMLTAKTDEFDRVMGLEMGADDYITKPFSLRELLARIKSVLRRVQPQTEKRDVLRRGELVIDEEKFRVWKQDQEIALTPAEFQLLVTLARRPGVVYSRLQLLQATMGDAYLNYERTIDSHISHLRKKIESDPSNPQYIQTVHGVGYRFGDQL